MLKFLKKLFVKKSEPTASVEVETTSVQDEVISSQDSTQTESFIEKVEDTSEQDEVNVQESVKPEKKTAASKPRAAVKKKTAATKTAAVKKTAATKDEVAVVKKKTTATKAKTTATKAKTTATKAKTTATKAKTTATKDEPAATKAKTTINKKKTSPVKASSKAASVKVDDVELSSDEKIKLVKVQKSPVKKNQILESKRQSKKYSVSVTPQAAGSFEYNEAKKIELFVLAGSKQEALETLATKLSGEEPSYEGTNVNSGQWLEGNRYSLNITGFEKASK